MTAQATLRQLAKEHGTPLFVVDHDVLRKNYARFRRLLPDVQAYYAVKANPDPAIVKTLYDAGASFDVASLPEFRVVHENIQALPAHERQAFIWDKIIYANPIKANETLQELDYYGPLVTYDNLAEIGKIKKYAPHAGLVLRIDVPNTGAMVDLSTKFVASQAEAVDLIAAGFAAGLTVEGISFHVGSQTTSYGNFVTALQLAAGVFAEAARRGFDKLHILDIGGGFPAPYDESVRPLEELAELLNAELKRLFPPHIQILAEPGRGLVATAATVLVKVIGKAIRGGRPCYYVDDGVYHTFSGILFDHCQYHLKAFREGPTERCSVFGPTCDALDTISVNEQLPELDLDDLLYTENIGAYSHASSTWFNGFPPAKVLHINV